METKNKAPQATKKPQMVDISKLHTPSGYARLTEQSRANVYLQVNSGKIPAEKVFDVDGQMLISE